MKLLSDYEIYLNESKVNEECKEQGRLPTATELIKTNLEAQARLAAKEIFERIEAAFLNIDCPVWYASSVAGKCWDSLKKEFEL